MIHEYLVRQNGQLSQSYDYDFDLSRDTYATGMTVPIQFKLRDFKDTSIKDAKIHVFYNKLGNEGRNTPVAATAAGGRGRGNLCRYNPATDRYLFAFNTKELGRGIYQLVFVLESNLPNVGAVGSVNIELT